MRDWQQCRTIKEYRQMIESMKILQRDRQYIGSLTSISATETLRERVIVLKVANFNDIKHRLYVNIIYHTYIACMYTWRSKCTLGQCACFWFNKQCDPLWEKGPFGIVCQLAFLVYSEAELWEFFCTRVAGCHEIILWETGISLLPHL